MIGGNSFQVESSVILAWICLQAVSAGREYSIGRHHTKIFIKDKNRLPHDIHHDFDVRPTFFPCTIEKIDPGSLDSLPDVLCFLFHIDDAVRELELLW
jgi:hypothetical protein